MLCVGNARCGSLGGHRSSSSRVRAEMSLFYISLTVGLIGSHYQRACNHGLTIRRCFAIVRQNTGTIPQNHSRAVVRLRSILGKTLDQRRSLGFFPRTRTTLGLISRQPSHSYHITLFQCLTNSVFARSVFPECLNYYTIGAVSRFVQRSQDKPISSITYCGIL
jgi:hypothetical protein